MKFDPDESKKTTSYFFALLPCLVTLIVALLNQSDNKISNNIYILSVIMGMCLSYYLFRLVGIMFSFSLSVSPNLIYLMSERLNHRLAWDDVKSVYLGRFSWFIFHSKAPWICFFHKNDRFDKHLIFKLSILSNKDVIKLLDQVKKIAQDRSIEINY
ncbi:MAG: hypothetical protein Q7K65_01135 [Candidatus Buchananbacteria bacterium]|nr:hypothetical protein [Candidatus Buchananbacteria bacterium]